MARKPSKSSTPTRSGESSTDLSRAQLAETRRRLQQLPPKPIEEGKVVGRCVTCGGETAETANLERHFILPGREVVVTGLSGEKCLRCGEEWLDAQGAARLIPYEEQRIIAHFRGKVTKYGGRNLGHYFNRDLESSAGLTKDIPTRVFLLDENSILIKLDRHRKEPAESEATS